MNKFQLADETQVDQKKDETINTQICLQQIFDYGKEIRFSKR
jgi:hypothetical protein